MVRYENWPQRLSAYLSFMRNEPFEWGKNDCVLYSMKGVEALTGINVYQQYIGYTDEAGAQKIIEDNSTIEQLVSKHLGESHRNFMKARRGDVVLVKSPELTCGIVDDSGEYIAVITKKGYMRLPLRKAWRIWSY